MKKFSIVVLSSFILLFLSACSISQTDIGGSKKDILIKDEISQTSNSGEQLSWIPEDYTGAIVVITEANSGDVIVQTGDQLLYRNEIYGFQVLLGKDWKGVEISKDTYRGLNKIVFLKKYNGPEWEFESDFPIFIIPPERFYKDWWYLEDAGEDTWSHRKNNHYFFRPAGGQISHFLVSYFFPSIPCVTTEEKWYKERLCEHWIVKIFSGFSAFDI